MAVATRRQKEGELATWQRNRKGSTGGTEEGEGVQYIHKKVTTNTRTITHRREGEELEGREGWRWCLLMDRVGAEYIREGEKKCVTF